MDWDQYFMSLVFFVAMKSKDQSTQIGAVVVDSKNRIVSVGYNGFPRGANDCVAERQERPEKYNWFCHAEANAVYNARSPLDGCTMYTSGIPCTNCAMAIIQAGIKVVIVDKYWDMASQDYYKAKWGEQAKRTMILFEECGVVLLYYEGPLVQNVCTLRNGHNWQQIRNKMIKDS